MSKSNKKLKIRFCTFAIAKYGGIVGHIEAKFKALQDMGHDVDIIILDYSKNLPISQFHSKIKKLEEGTFQESLDIKSQNGGYVKSKITNYWTNPYYGWLLEPGKNRLPCLKEESIEDWKKLVEDVDIIFWSFVPTKTSEAKGFNWWHKYFDLPKKTKQILSIHDGYYDLRNSWTNLLKNKISFMECVHITSYNACEVFDIPRTLNFDSRFIENKFSELKKKRKIDFFSAHIFKSMKRMEELVSAQAYVKSDIEVAGSGIELYYMMTETEEKQKPKYTVSIKTDPDRLEKDEGKSLWKRAEENGMKYLGLISNDEVIDKLRNSKFAIDPSFCTHYAKYVNTHLNGFIIEAMINGSYPILRNYRKDQVENDFIFQEINAIFIPYDATPKEFAKYLNSALKMPEEKFLRHTKENFEMAKNLLNPKTNMKYIVDLVSDKKYKELEIGQSNEKIRKDADSVMIDFFGYAVDDLTTIKQK